jgi:hypothetical protein
MSARRRNPYKGREAVMFDFAVAAQGRGEHFYYVRVPGNIKPRERGKRFEDPLQAALESSTLGYVAGGGSQLGEGNTIEYCGIDVFVTRAGLGLRLLRRELEHLEAPAGTTIEEYLPKRADHLLYEDGWVQATLDYAFCRLLSQWPSAPDRAR